jgi:hypothetical protein
VNVVHFGVASGIKYGVSKLCDLSRTKYWNMCMKNWDAAQFLDSITSSTNLLMNRSGGSGTRSSG